MLCGKAIKRKDSDTPRRKNNPNNFISFNIFHQNIASFRNKTLEVEEVITELKNKPDILCISELWMTAGKIPFVKIQDYQLASHYARTDMEHEGSASTLY
ncbi:hypothetical protein JTB14_023518 [Gonioctena quinquepunctata]|nr:hypothetical protein JTB14_023518 [Gonioctena quinquepunctata]